MREYVLMGRPEILAPAGDRESLRAALAAGADAVYFGLDEGFNARARAANFPLEGLAALVDEIHFAGARAYLTLNTLIFESELRAVERIVREAGRCGVDALIVQDPAVASIARWLCPAMEVHASTQMTISSPEASRFAERLGVTRVVLPRELSVEEIERFCKATSLETEVFIAGALCMAWSGQCLSSEAWGGRSANRGQCAQACRLPYDLVVDGERRDLGDVAYLLSPSDLAGNTVADKLARLGVHTLKIEGRQKGPNYVYEAVRSVRSWLEGQPELRNLSLTYSRGFGPGFFEGSDHQTLVEGRTPRHRGLRLGAVFRRDGSSVWVRDEGTVEPIPGMGVVFLTGQRTAQEDEVGGPIFHVDRDGDSFVLGFGNPGPDLRKVHPGAEVWVTSDPKLEKKLHRLVEAGWEGRLAVDLRVSGFVGQPLQVVARQGAVEVSCASEHVLQFARSGGLDDVMLRDKLGQLGGTPFHLASFECRDVSPGLFLPVSELKNLRRRFVDELCARLPDSWRREVRPEPFPPPAPVAAVPASRNARIVPLCRTPEQLEAVIESGLGEVILDWMELVGLASAVQRAREAGLRVGIATVRIQKPGEEVYDRRIAALKPDFILARHWGAVMASRERSEEIWGDFSLNVTNSVTANLLRELGVKMLTASHDLDKKQLLAMLEHFPAADMSVVVHHHIPTFHTEHCVYSHLLSSGRDYRTCGRPCEKHQVGLQDRKGVTHPVIVDVGCRNTVFNGKAQSAASFVPELVEAGVEALRVEFVWEDREQALTVIRAYRDLLAGRATPADTLQRVRAHEQFGVSLGTMQVLT